MPIMNGDSPQATSDLEKLQTKIAIIISTLSFGTEFCLGALFA
jgi:hypothetical protein